MRPLRAVVRFIGIIQILFGALFLLAPAHAASALGLEPAAPAWANWLFAMMGARFLGYGIGMIVAARDPREHVAWIDTMIGVQVVDWVATLAYVLGGTLTLGQVTTAAFLPPLFVVALLAAHPRRLAAGAGA